MSSKNVKNAQVANDSNEIPVAADAALADDADTLQDAELDAVSGGLKPLKSAKVAGTERVVSDDVADAVAKKNL